MSNNTKEDAKDVRYYLECAAQSINDAKRCAGSIKDPDLHKQISETKAKVDGTVKYLNDRLNPRKGG